MLWVVFTVALLVATLIAIVVAYVSGQTDGAKFFVQVFSGIGVILAVLTALYRDAITNLVDRIHLRIELPEQPDNYVRSKLFTVEVRVRKVEPTEGWLYEMKPDVEIIS